MKPRYFFGITAIAFIITVCIGLYNKSFFTDYNEEEDPINHFLVALLPDEFAVRQVEVMDEMLDLSKIILAVQCEDTFTYRFASTTQKVRILSVFKGEGLAEGDTIEIARAGTLISVSEELREQPGKGVINMGFVNEMIPGKTYLVFLHRQLQTWNEKSVIYIQSDRFLVAPIFCYEEIENTLAVPLDNETTYVNYDSVRNNEFFLSSEEAVQRFTELKRKFISKYAYN